MTVERSHTFGSLLKSHRSAAGLTQEELAVRAGLGARTISNLERGISRSPYRSTVRRLADALGLSGEDLAQFAASGPLDLKHSSSGGRMAGAEEERPCPLYEPVDERTGACNIASHHPDGL